MPRKAQAGSKDTKQLLIDAAAHEFSEKDYDHASLRQICSRAGVTTGALYFFFENKEDLMRSTIEPLTSSLLSLVKEWYLPFISRGDIPADEQHELDVSVANAIIDIASEFRIQLQIALHNREHPAVVEFTDALTELVELNVGHVLGYEVSDAREGKVTGLWWFAHMQIDGVLAIIECDLPREEAVDHILHLMKFLRGGVAAIRVSE